MLLRKQEAESADPERRTRAAVIPASLALLLLLGGAATVAWFGLAVRPVYVASWIVIGPRCGEVVPALTGKEKLGWRTYVLGWPSTWRPGSARAVDVIIDIHPDPRKVSTFQSADSTRVLRGRRLTQWAGFALIER